MNTLSIIKLYISIILTALTAQISTAQTADTLKKGALRFSLERGAQQEMTLPPGSEFLLFNASGKLVLTEKDLEGSYTIREEQVVLYQPSYKDEFERMELRKGDQIRWVKPLKNQDYGRNREKSVSRTHQKKTKKNDYGRYSGGVTLRKEFLESSDEDERNVLLVFSNGLVFRYFEGDTRAWYNGEPVAIKDRYIIDTGKETVKFSYDPRTGKVWYVVDTNDKSTH
ncbi:hypothetical protein SAMN04490243_2664 [Robiginitalea myxolifaciens]|uniref:YD repeat-containing protein n=1 Tax=Robiginitalea myxolifaciens TaxID=400055 RepID=A0A1I6HEW9_9FLAO|nr:hypothetical protein [Robiginitalea myxolifaciens]SFR53032.1 hypothetical protein SAMN04490243_2664 [Robiginitalea myxolifaciens]